MTKLFPLLVDSKSSMYRLEKNDPFFRDDNVARVAFDIEKAIQTRIGDLSFKFNANRQLVRAMVQVAEDRPEWLATPNRTDGINRLNQLVMEKMVSQMTELSAGGQYVADGSYAPGAGPTNGGCVGAGRIQGAGRLHHHREKNERDETRAPNRARYTFGGGHMTKYHRQFRDHQRNITAKWLTNGLETRFDMTLPSHVRAEREAQRQEFSQYK